MRPNKVGIDYFSHDTHMIDSSEMKIVVAKYKAIGYALYNYILECAYRENGYYFEYNEDNVLLASSYLGIDYEKCEEIILFMVEKGLFEKNVFNSFKIVSSARMQRTYIRACEQRLKIYFELAYLLVDPQDEKTKKSKFEIVYTDIYSVKTVLNLDKTVFCTQSKVKESKVKESKVKESKRKEREIPALSDVKNFFLKQLRADLAEKFYNYYAANNWVTKSGQEIYDWQSMALVWISRESQFGSKKTEEVVQDSRGEFEKETCTKIADIESQAMLEIFKKKIFNSKEYKDSEKESQDRIRNRFLAKQEDFKLTQIRN